MNLLEYLLSSRQLKVRQQAQTEEWLIGFPVRNKYQIHNETNNIVGFAAERDKGALDTFLRFFFRRWRSFEISIFNTDHRRVLRLRNLFRFVFRRMEIDSESGMIGALQQRFSIMYKKFDIQNPRKRLLLRVRAPFWKPWTFSISKNGIEVAVVKKEWAGALKEIVIDADNFSITYKSSSLLPEERFLILAAALFIDVTYYDGKRSFNISNFRV